MGEIKIEKKKRERERNEDRVRSNHRATAQ